MFNILNVYEEHRMESEGYTVYSAMDGEEAVKIFIQHKNEIALVLTDVGLPKMNGIDEFRKLKKIDPSVKVLLASGFFEPDSKLELRRAVAKGFIQKPYIPQVVLQKIRRVLNNALDEIS